MKKLLTLAVALVALATMADLTYGQAAAPLPLVQYRAGTAVFASGKDGINIIFTHGPMPSLNYSVVVQATNTAGYSPISVCTYFNPLHKRLDGFEVQHKRCDDGVPVKLDTNVSLDYVAIAKY
ncbi:MAG TPA: hypothetical protein VGW39_16515 [Chthoniobacterales bacterium]|nr:hypothetical protein [Chthoniobacterales bacterium]